MGDPYAGTVDRDSWTGDPYRKMGDQYSGTDDRDSWTGDPYSGRDDQDFFSAR